MMRLVCNTIGAVALCAAVSACNTTSGGDFCDIATLHRFSDKAVDAMTDSEVARELAFNETVERLCKVKP